MDQQLERIRKKSQLLLEKRQRVPLNTATKLLENFNQIKLLMSQCQLEPDSQCEDQKETVITSLELIGLDEISSFRDHPVAPPLAKTQHSLHPQVPTIDENIDSLNQSVRNGDENTSKGPLLVGPISENSAALLPAPPPPTVVAAPILRSRNQFNGTISTEDFNNVATHIRGRCTLHDTQRLLTHLRTVSRPSTASSSAPQMSVQQLDQLGYRVCGQTGLCMLKTLQKLGYVELSKRGDLVWLSALGLQGVPVQQPLTMTTQRRRK
jgi:hypothetical protein